MKKICLLLLLQATALVLFAQKGWERFDPVKEQKTFNGYTVRVMPAIGGGYGFDILQNNKPVVHQYHNPLPYVPKGVEQKDDAFKIAKWMITQYGAKRRWEAMPPQVAQRLRIQTR